MATNETTEIVVRSAPRDLAPFLMDAPGMHVPADAGATLIEVFWQRHVLIGISLGLAVLAAAAYLLVTPKVYESTARLVIEQSGPRLLTESQGVMLKSETFLFAQCERILSAPILTDALDRLNHGGAGYRSLTTDNPLKKLKESLSADVGKRDDIVAVSFDGPDPNEAAQIANTVVQSYIENVSRGQRTAASDVLKILSREKEKRETERAVQGQALLKFRQTNGVLGLANNEGNIITQKLVTISTALTAAELATIDAKVAADALNAWANDPRTQSLKVPTGLNVDKETQTLLTELSNAQLRLSVKTGGLAANHPSVRAEQSYITDLRLRVVDAGQQGLARAQAREVELRRAFTQQRDEATSLTSVEAEKVRLEGDLRRTEQMCELLDARIKELTINEQAGALNITVIEDAAPDMKAVEPRPLRILGVGGLIGLVAGLAGALVRDRTDQRLRSPQDVLSLIGLPILGVVPRILAGQRGVRYLTAHAQPMSPASEAYRTIRTAIRFGASGTAAKTVLVTSAAPGEGKSTSASNLAISLAQAGYSTILVEADLRKPVMKDIFLSRSKGSINRLLRGEAVLEESIRPTDIDNLHVLLCDQPVQRPAEVIAGSEFKAILDRLKNNYQYVVVDSSPVCPVSDARVLATFCDVAIMVVCAGKSSRKMTHRAVSDLLGVGAKLLGVVVNNISKSSQRSFNEYGGYYYAQPATTVVSESSRQGSGHGEVPLLPMSH